jgi:hypothetical protein
MTPRPARVTNQAMSSIGPSSPLLYGGTSSTVGRRTPGPRSTASLSRHDLARLVPLPENNLIISRSSATPRAHRRGDLGQQYNSSSRSPYHRREVVLVRENQSGQLTSESHIVPPPEDEDSNRVIWGTNVSISECMQKFREFLLGFQKKHRLRADNIPFEEGEGEEHPYVEMLKTVTRTVIETEN